MKRQFKIIVGAILCLWSFSVFADDKIKLKIDRSKPTFEIRLSANPTTGYQWKLVDYNRSLFEMTGSTFVKPDTNLIGAGGTRIFNFKLKKDQQYPDKSKMMFKYARPWDASSATNTTVVIHFVDKPTLQTQP